MKVFRVSVVEKVRVAGVHTDSFSGVFDGAPVLLSSRRDFTGIGKYAVCVAAIDAVQLLDVVQIRKSVSIDGNESRAVDPLGFGRSTLGFRANRPLWRKRRLVEENGHPVV